MIAIKLQADLNKLMEWSRIWRMEFSVKKRKVLRVVRKKCISERDYFHGETKKDLGILISHDLSSR